MISKQKEVEYTYGEDAVVESLQVFITGTNPLQVKALVSGYLPDTCTELHQIIVERQNQEINLIVQTRRPVDDNDCLVVDVPFVETVDLDAKGCEAGTYYVNVGVVRETFKLKVYEYDQDANVESLQVFVLGPKPLQVTAQVSGHLNSTSTELYGINVKREGQDFILILQTRQRPIDDANPPYVEVPFLETINLDIKNLPPGTYYVRAGNVRADFDFDDIYYGQDATLESLQAFVLNTDPARVQVLVKGYLPDPCTDVDDILVERQGNEFVMTIQTSRYPGECLDVQMLFGKVIELDVKNLKPGTYTVTAHGLQDSFTI